MTTKMTQAYDWRGREVVDNDGQKIGTVEELYGDSGAEAPEWAAVRTGLFGTKQSLLPLSGAEPSGERVRVPLTKDQVKDAPNIDPEGQLSADEEARLYSHYGMAGGFGAGGRRSGRRERASSDEAMTRSEEEHHVGTERHEAGRVRLRKWVETEEVQKTVPVRKERARIEREPVTDANADAALSGEDITDSEHEVVLHEEEAVVEKRTVPKERVRLEKDVETGERQVSEEVRKERIDAEGDVKR